MGGGGVSMLMPDCSWGKVEDPALLASVIEAGTMSYQRYTQRGKLDDLGDKTGKTFWEGKLDADS